MDVLVSAGPSGSSAATATATTTTGLARSQSLSIDSAMANEIFDHFCSASTLKSILRSYRYLCEVLRVKPGQLPHFYPRLRSKLKSWKAQAIWAKFDKRISHKVYKGGKICAGQRVLVIGSGPCGLRTAIEAQLLGAKVVVMEKRDRFSRNNVLHLWPYNITDLRGLAAKKFYGKFCAGAIDHISIRQLQCILLKVSLLLGVEVFENVGFEDLIEPVDAETGWKATVSPPDHPVSQYEFDVLIGADGKRNTLHGFKRKEFRGKLAIAITANLINRHTEAESQVEEISGVAFIFNQKFFNDLNDAKGISLENIVYYKDETHYFVMTAKKQSLLNKGVIMHNDPDTAKLLAPDNINQEALFEYAREAADFATNYNLPHLEFAVNHYGKPDVAMFDFTSMFQAENSCRVVERHGHRLLTGLVGDSLLEPFWPTGTGCARGFFGGLDTCWLMRSLALGKQTWLEALAERESIYRILNQTTPENTCKDYASYTVDPHTRYPTLNKKLVLPFQVTHLVDSDNPNIMEEELQQSSSSAAAVTAKHLHDSAKKKRRRDSHVSPDTLLTWFQRQLESYDCVAVTDMTYSFQNGLAICAIINRYRPELIEFDALDATAWAENNQIAFDILEHDLGIPPAMSGKELAASKNPDKLAMISYLSQIYELFRKDIPVLKQAKLDASDDDLLDSQYRHNHPKSSKSGMRRRQHHGEDRMSIGQLVASDAAGVSISSGHGKKKKRRSKENEDESSPNKENIEETLRMNRSAHRKRLQRLMERAEASGESKRKLEMGRTSIKKDERYKIIEEQFAGAPRRRNVDSVSKYRENKKPKDLKRAIGKLDKDDWNVKNIEDKLVTKTKVEGVHKDKVPKWSKAAFQDKFNIMKGKLESSEEPETKYAEIDSSLARLQRKLRDGSALEVGQRGANKVAALAGELFKEDEVAGASAATATASAPTPVEKKEVFAKAGSGSECCHFCDKRVYVVERMSAEGKFFHRSCFRCDYCKILLRMGSYVYLREGHFKGKFFCLPHSTAIALQKYRYRCKADELRDAENLQKELVTKPVSEWDEATTTAREEELEDGRRNPLEYLESLPDRHKERLLRHDRRRGNTPERVEFEASIESEEEVPSIMDEDEWTDRNFGKGDEEEEKKSKDQKRRRRKVEKKEEEEEDQEDTSEDSVSDLETDSDDDDEDDDEEEGDADSRPLTANETRQLHEEWVKKNDPRPEGSDEEEEAAGASRYENDEKHRHSSSSDSSDSEDDECVYDGEYESSSEDDEDCSDSADEEEGGEKNRPSRPPLPAAQASKTSKTTAQARRKDSRQQGSKQPQQQKQKRQEENDSSTEVGTDDLSSDEDSEDEFSSGSATECEFTDSEGRPNPFHKDIEEGRVIGPESPDASLRIIQQHKIPASAVPQNGNDASSTAAASGGGPMTYAAKYQYKTPNLSDRLRVEEQKSTTTIQDFSTRKALNLKKNWVSESATNIATRQKVSSAEVDNKLKSLMDRLSSQQKLLKPADKPSTQMQHFLSSQQLIMPPKMSQTNVKSPPIVTSPLTSSSSVTTNALRLYPTPPIYRSTSSDTNLSSTISTNNVTEKVPAEVLKLCPVDLETKAEPPCKFSCDSSSSATTSSSSSSEDQGDAAVSSPPSAVVIQKDIVSIFPEPALIIESRDDSKTLLHPPQLAVPEGSLNESGGSKDDDFQSCDENEKATEGNRVNEAINCSYVSHASTDGGGEFATPGSFNQSSVMEEDKVQQTPDCPPLATSSPLDYNDFELIDEGVEDSIIKEVGTELESPEEEQKIADLPKQPVVLILTEDDNTKIYNERNPQERMARMKSCKDREKSVIHDLIMGSRVNNQRSSSGVRRSARVFPTSNIPPPPPPTEMNSSMATKINSIRPPPPPVVTTTAGRTGNAPSCSPPIKLEKEQNSPHVRDQAFSTAAEENDRICSSADSTPQKRPSVCLPATPLTNPEQFGIPASKNPPDSLRLSARPVGRYESVFTKSSASLSPTASGDGGGGGGELVSPTESSTSNDMEYLDGIASTDESAASSGFKSRGNNSHSNHKDKKTFMKTISGMFNRSASVSAINRQPRSPEDTHPGSPTSVPTTLQQQQQLYNSHQSIITASSNNSKELKAPTATTNSNFRFPRLNFARSSSVQRDPNKHHQRPTSPTGEAPRADMSEFGSLASLSSSSAVTSKRDQQPNTVGMFPLVQSHPSTPPVPLTRKITIGGHVGAPMANSESGAADSLSENEENESPDSSLNSTGGSSEKRRQYEEEVDVVEGHRRGQQLPPEILEKIMRRGGKSARRAARVAQVKRVRKAQEIQRLLEELDVQRKECEDRGIRAEQSLRGEVNGGGGGGSSVERQRKKSEGELMHTWFQLLTEKNRLVRREQELLVQAKQLEMEDRSARLEVELREHLMLDCRSAESVAREGVVLKEMMEISEQREKLQAMLQRDQERYQREDKDIEAQMLAKGIRIVAATTGGVTAAAARKMVKS